MLVRLGTLAAVIACACALRRGPSTTTIVVAQPAPPAPPPLIFPVLLPTTIEVPIAAASERATCPAPRDDAPRSVPRSPPGYAMLATNVMVAPTNAGWVAAWNDGEVYVSRDAGMTYAKVLSGTGRVKDVTFDCFGRAIVVRGTQLGIADARGESWRAIPGIRDDEGDTAVLAGGGPDVAILAPFGDGEKPHIAVTHDLGATWRHRDLDTFWEGGHRSQLREDADGTLHVMLIQPDCMSTVIWWAKAPIDHLEQLVDRSGPGMGDGGTASQYGNMLLTDSHWYRPGEPDWTRVDGIPADEWWLPLAGALPAMAHDGTVARIIDGKAYPLPIVAGDATIETIDRAGRVWGLHCGMPVVLGAKPLAVCGE